MAITAAQVKELREITGAGRRDCKKALGETDGAAMRERIETRHGHHQLAYMSELGMGNRKYLLLDVDQGDKRVQPSDAVEGVVPSSRPHTPRDTPSAAACRSRRSSPGGA